MTTPEYERELFDNYHESRELFGGEDLQYPILFNLWKIRQSIDALTKVIKEKQ